MSHKTLSYEVSMALDILGYRLEMIKWRRHSYSRLSDLLTGCMSPAPKSLTHLTFKPYLTGSKKEGTSIWNQSDEDFMIIFDKLICSPDPQDTSRKSDNIWIKMQMDKINPGYALLQTTQSKTNVYACIEQMVCQLSDGTQCLASGHLNRLLFNAYKEAFCSALKERDNLANHLMDYIISKAPHDSDEADKYKLKITSEEITLDVVAALPCIIPELLARWKERERKHGWPDADRLRKILGMPSHVVSKGSKKSDKEHLQFRISYTMQEIELVKSLNEIQIKLYVLLKKLLQAEIETHFPDVITSYAVKNLVFWICEDTPPELFTRDLLLDRVLQALKFLAQCINKGILPCYFIPQRNLLEGKLCEETKRKICDILSSMLSKGQSVVLKINEIHREVLRIRRDFVMALLTGHCRNIVEMETLKRREDSFRQYKLQAIDFVSREVYNYFERISQLK